MSLAFKVLTLFSVVCVVTSYINIRGDAPWFTSRQRITDSCKYRWRRRWRYPHSKHRDIPNKSQISQTPHACLRNIAEIQNIPEISLKICGFFGYPPKRLVQIFLLINFRILMRPLLLLGSCILFFLFSYETDYDYENDYLIFYIWSKYFICFRT